MAPVRAFSADDGIESMGLAVLTPTPAAAAAWGPARSGACLEGGGM